MNIKVPHSFLKTLLETKENPHQIAEILSLSGPSVEKVEKVKDDFVYHIEVTTNRLDAFSVWGIAQEIYARFSFLGKEAKLTKPQGLNIEPKLETKELPLKVRIEKEELCPRFTAIILDNVTVKPSPSWMQKHLGLCGIRFLNNIVDISNYLTLELGRPMHTFDYDKIKKASLILRESGEGEEIVTLDGQKRKLKKGAIIIEDDGRLIDLCGIMGGENSQIDEGTKRVLLFVQTYNPSRIRQTSKDLNLRTEASTRFEKGLDTEGVIGALNRAVWLAKELSGAKVASKVIDIYPHPYKPKVVTLSKTKLDQYLGVKIDLLKARGILESLGFETTIAGPQIKAKVPSYRAQDIEIEEDLIEEIARIWGYEKLPSLLPAGELKPKPTSIFYWESRIKDYLKYQGLTEVYTYSMISQEDLEAVNFNPNDALKIKNPLNSDLEYMRPTLLPSLLKVVAQNQKRRENLAFFEIANTYTPTKTAELPQECMRVAGIWQTRPLTAEPSPTSQDEVVAGGRSDDERANDFYALKGILEGLSDDLGAEVEYSPKNIPNFVSGQTALITTNGAELGRIGKVEPKIAKSFGVEGDIFVFGLDFAILAQLAKLTKEYKPISKYPEVAEDISMIIDERKEIGQVLEVIQKAGDRLLKRTEVFDIFKNPKLGKNKKSVAVHLSYQSQTHNLSSKEVEEVRKKIIKSLEENLGAKVRLK